LDIAKLLKIFELDDIFVVGNVETKKAVTWWVTAFFLGYFDVVVG
jgi:hypothetical protein